MRHSLGLWARRVLNWFVVHRLGAFVVTLVALDQFTKALVPRSWVTVDPATGAYLPSFLRDQWKGPMSGALLDGTGVCVLGVLGWLVARRLRTPLTRLGGSVLLAGLASNLLDRLGLAAITQHVNERGVVNWFYVGFGSLGMGNIADLCYLAGISLLLAGALQRLFGQRHATDVAKAQSRVPKPWPGPLLGAVFVTVAALSIAWAGFWQGDRRAVAASAEVHGTQAQLQSTTEDLDEAVLEAYVHGDNGAQLLLPSDQWITCSERGGPVCSIETN